MGKSLDVNYSGIAASGAVLNLFLGMHSRLGNCRKLRSNQQIFALLQPLERGLPSIGDRAL